MEWRLLAAWYGSIAVIFGSAGVMIGLNAGRMFVPFVGPVEVTTVQTWTVYDIWRKSGYRIGPGEKEVSTVETCTVDVGLSTTKPGVQLAGPLEARTIYEDLPCDLKMFLKVRALVNKPMRCVVAVPMRRTVSGRLVEERWTNNTPPPDRLATFAKMAQECEV